MMLQKICLWCHGELEVLTVAKAYVLNKEREATRLFARSEQMPRRST